MIPGEQISKAITALWKQSLFSGVEITAPRIDGDKIFLQINLEEKPRLSRFRIISEIFKRRIAKIS
jgi:outer membrane protein insertion porin family